MLHVCEIKSSRFFLGAEKLRMGGRLLDLHLLGRARMGRDVVLYGEKQRSGKGLLGKKIQGRKERRRRRDKNERRRRRLRD